MNRMRSKPSALATWIYFGKTRSEPLHESLQPRQTREEEEFPSTGEVASGRKTPTHEHLPTSISWLSFILSAGRNKPLVLDPEEHVAAALRKEVFSQLLDESLSDSAETMSVGSDSDENDEHDESILAVEGKRPQPLHGPLHGMRANTDGIEYFVAGEAPWVQYQIPPALQTRILHYMIGELCFLISVAAQRELPLTELRRLFR